MPAPDALHTLVARYDAEAFDAPPGRTTLRLEVEGRDAWDAILEDGLAALVPAGHSDQAGAVMSADLETWRSIGRDVAGGLDAYRAGRLSVRRNLHLAVGFLAATSGDTDPGRLRLKTIRPKGARFSILEAGLGDPVVMLHGLGATKASFLPVVEGVARTHRAIAIDLPGFGDSGKPLRAAYDAAFFARSVVSLLDELGLDQAHVIGHSMGGRVALELGMAHDERIASLTLMTPSLAWLRERRWLRYVRLLRPELGLLQAAPRGAVEAVLKRIIPGSASHWVQTGIDEFVRSYTTPRGRAAFYAAARQIYLEEGSGDEGFWERLRLLRPPSLFIWGRWDELVPIGFERHVKQTVSNARHIELDCGHVPQLERPRETNTAITRFLRAVPPVEVAEAV